MQFIKSHIFLIILIIGIACQVLCAIFGFDMSDEGFLMTLYRDFGDSADAGKTGSGYPLSCFIGWCASQVTPGNLLAMRLWGIGMVTVLVLIIYTYLKNKVSKPLLSAGLLLMMLVMCNDPKPLGYNNITGLIATLSLISIVEGSLRKNIPLLAIGGMLIGFNTFVRLPNILDISFAAIPFAANFTSWKKLINKSSILQMLFVVIGAFCGGALSWLLMMRFGADQNVIAFLGTITGQLNGDSSHSSSSMIIKLVGNYSLAIEYLCLYIIAILALTYVSHCRKYIAILASALILFQYYRVVYIGSSLLGDQFFATFNGIGLFGAIVYSVWGSPFQRTISLAAALMSIVLPLGSDQGFVTMWNGPWVSLPLGLCATPLFIEKMQKYLNLHLSLTSKQTNRSFAMQLSTEGYHRSIYFICLALVITTCVKTYHKCYYDPGDRFAKTYAIDSKFAVGVHTAKDKAVRFNPMLAELRNYAKAGDTILAYDWSPMLFYITGTKPYANISWPCVYYGMAYVKEIEKAEKQSKDLPVIVLQNYRATELMRTEYYDSRFAQDVSEMAMINCINEFTIRHHYRKVWTNGWYEILLPPGKKRLEKASEDW